MADQPDGAGPITITREARLQPKLVKELRQMELDAGYIGRLVGGPKNAPNNIAFVVVVLVLLAGLAAGVFAPADRAEVWKYIAPIVTLTLGYLFGRNSAS
jgi:hypothetical protein